MNVLKGVLRASSKLPARTTLRSASTRSFYRLHSPILAHRIIREASLSIIGDQRRWCSEVRSESSEAFAGKQSPGTEGNEHALQTYEGDRDSASLPHGKGRLSTPKFDYEGEFENGAIHGQGMMTFKHDDKKWLVSYEGEFKMGKRDGKGVMTFRNGKKFTGTFEENKPIEGVGPLYTQGARSRLYEGPHVGGKREGEGTDFYEDGGTYEGSFANDLRHGKGVRTLPWGCVCNQNYEHGKILEDFRTYKTKKHEFVGEFKDGKKFRGTQKTSMYTFFGDFDEGPSKGKVTTKEFEYEGTLGLGMIPDGFGKITYDLKSRKGKSRTPKQNIIASYEGTWKYGKQHGNGKATFANGDVYVGGWSNGTRDGHGKITYGSTGKEHDCKFSLGKLVEGHCTGRSFGTGREWEGQMLNGKFHGFGKIRENNGTYREGTWEEGKMVGEHRVYSKFGQLLRRIDCGEAKYEGDVDEEGRYHGTGKLTEGDGDNCRLSYAGEFKNGLFHGLGKLVDKYKVIYEGEFENGLRHGKGTLTSPGLGVLEGVFAKQKVVSGTGPYIIPGGRHLIRAKILAHQWKDGKAQGPGQIIDQSTISHGSFVDSKPVGEFKVFAKDGTSLITTRVYGADDPYDSQDFESTLTELTSEDDSECSNLDGDDGDGGDDDGDDGDDDDDDDVDDGSQTSDEAESIISMPEGATLDQPVTEVTGTFGTYKGTLDTSRRKDRFHGFGRLVERSGVVYEGTWHHGQKHGFGKETHKNGDQFIGRFEKGQPVDGEGVVLLKLGRYFGVLLDGHMQGEGVLIHKGSGDVYVGNFVDGRKEGKGRLVYTDGTYIDAEFVGNLPHDGEGCLRHAIEKWVYRGAIRAGKKEGEGMLIENLSKTNKIYRKYEGAFADGEYHGTGRMTWSDGRSFEGTFRMGSIEAGEGTWESPPGHYMTGSFVNGQRNGVFTCEDSNGDVSQVTFENGMPIEGNAPDWLLSWQIEHGAKKRIYGVDFFKGRVLSQGDMARTKASENSKRDKHNLLVLERRKARKMLPAPKTFTIPKHLMKAESEVAEGSSVGHSN